MKGLVLIPEPIAVEGEAFLLERGYSLRHGTGTDADTLICQVRGCDGALVRMAHFSQEVLAAGDRLRVVAKHGAGVDNIDVAAATRLGIRVVNAPLGMTRAVAEYTVGVMLALAKQLARCDAAFRASRDFSLRHALAVSELAGATAGIVGMGRIGSAVAARLLAFEMRVLGFDPGVPQDRWPKGVERCASLADMLPACDHVTLHVPLTDGTRRLIGAREIAMMKSTAFLVNAARGGVVDEAALIAALGEGRLAGAGIDVFEQEPPPSDHPFFAMDNVILSPHNSALTAQATVRMAMDAARGIHEVLSGGEPTWPVNP